MPEPVFATLAEYAQLRRCSTRYLRRLRERGDARLVMDGDRVVVAASNKAFDEMTDHAKVRKPAPPVSTPAPTGAGQAVDLGDIGAQRTLMDAKRNESEARAKLLQLELAERAGNLVEREAVERVNARIGRQLIEALGSVADRTAAQIAGEFGADHARVYALIDLEIRRAVESAVAALAAPVAAAA